VRKFYFIAFLLFLYHSAFADGNIHAVLAPNEIAAGEQFTVIVSANPVSREQNRMIAIEFPENWKIVRAYAAEDGATESTPISQYPEMISYFQKEKGQAVRVFEDRTHVFAENYDGIAYFFVFSSPNATTAGNFKACLVERSDPGIPDKKETTKGKKQKPVRVKNFEWRVMSPSLGSNFSFNEVTGKKYSHQVRFISGWGNTSRALVLNENNHAQAHLNIHPELFRNFFNHPFTIEWWMRAVSGEQTLLRFEREDTSSGLLISANPFGQIEVHRYPGEEDSDIIMLSSRTVCDGAWHHITISLDMIGTFRMFTDGELDDTVINTISFFKDLEFCSIGEEKKAGHFAIDELQFIKRAVIFENEILPEIAIVARDTISDALALFHFEDFGRMAHSSIPIITSNKGSERGIIEYAYFSLDSGAAIIETSSPVLFDHAPLTVDQSAPNKITFSWKATSELGVKRYELQRRIATFGGYEKTVAVEAKRPIDADEEEKSIIARTSYSAAEKLPQLSHDIDLYYRLAIIGKHDSILYYTEPVKLEFGGARDVFVEQNKPNPFNPKTSITYRLVKNAQVNISVYDIMGRHVATLQDGKTAAGKHTVDIDATNWPGGIYFYKVKTAKTSVTKKMVLAK
jgi:hypothetical protein